MTYASTDPASLLADKRWRTRHSAWLLAVIFGFGVLSFVGYVYIGLRARTKKLWIAMVISCVFSAVPWVLSGDTDPTTEGTQISDLAAGVMLAVWIGLIVYGVIVNRDYLRWRAMRTQATAWYNQPVDNRQSAGPLAPAPAVPVQQTAPAPAPTLQQPTGALGVDASQYFAPASPPEPAPTPAQSPAAPVTPAPASAASGPVDVNAASAADIAAALRGDAALAERIVAARGQRGGFRDLDDLVAVAHVQPHEFIKLRGKVIFGPVAAPAAPEPAQAEQQQPPTSQTQPGGRILDF